MMAFRGRRWPLGNWNLVVERGYAFSWAPSKDGDQKINEIHSCCELEFLEDRKVDENFVNIRELNQSSAIHYEIVFYQSKGKSQDLNSTPTSLCIRLDILWGSRPMRKTSSHDRCKKLSVNGCTYSTCINYLMWIFCWGVCGVVA